MIKGDENGHYGTGYCQDGLEYDYGAPVNAVIACDDVWSGRVGHELADRSEAIHRWWVCNFGLYSIGMEGKEAS